MKGSERSKCEQVSERSINLGELSCSRFYNMIENTLSRTLPVAHILYARFPLHITCSLCLATARVAPGGDYFRVYRWRHSSTYVSFELNVIRRPIKFLHIKSSANEKSTRGLFHHMQEKKPVAEQKVWQSRRFKRNYCFCLSIFS